jgi:hypothetical protein
MANDDLRRGIVALQHALDARTVDWQVRHASEARQAYEAGRRNIKARLDLAAGMAEEDARAIAIRAAELDGDALDHFAEDLRVIEARVAAALRGERDIEAPYKRLLTDDGQSRE